MAFNRVLTKTKEPHEITVKTAWNFHFRTTKFTKMDDRRVQAKK